ncbi:MAG: phosphatase PAP2 family protein [Candidatus Aenigmarchaeota archaeon]|nr:phosphatase PAP2 family protein [Candidatus Aenigmarchaeota archaeon]
MTYDAILFNLMSSYGAFDVASLMAFISNAAFVLIVLSFIPIASKGRQGIIDYLALMLAAVSISIVLQQFFAVPRPPGAINAGSPYSFPSTHSTSSFAWAGFMGRNYGRYKGLYYVFAALVAVSRVYLGVHYPADVVAGGVLGLVISYKLAARRGCGLF